MIGKPSHADLPVLDGSDAFDSVLVGTVAGRGDNQVVQEVSWWNGDEELRYFTEFFFLVSSVGPIDNQIITSAEDHTDS